MGEGHSTGDCVFIKAFALHRSIRAAEERRVDGPSSSKHIKVPRFMKLGLLSIRIPAQDKER